MSPKIPISVVLISLNEEANIARALKSVEWAGDIVVYDSGSQDRTIEIARKMGANVTEGPWQGFGPTKRLAAERARFDWVLSIDCDEEVPEKLKNEIIQKLSSLNAQTVYRLPRLSFYLGRWIQYGGWYPDRQARLFNRKATNWNSEPVHEKIEAKTYENFASHLNHYVFKSIEHQIQTNNKYSGLQAEQMRIQGKTFSWFHFFTKPYVKFIECYFIKLGFLDGWAGYFIARSAAYSVFLKWSKLREFGIEKTGGSL